MKSGQDFADSIRWRKLLRRDLARHLQFGPDLTAYDSSGDKTAFLWAVHYGQVSFAQTLLDGGADITQKTGGSGMDAVCVAASQGWTEMLRWLLPRVDGLTQRADNGDMCVHVAAACGFNDVVTILAAHDASLLAARDGQGRTAYEVALKHGHRDTADAIAVLAIMNGALDGGSPTTRPVVVSRMRPKRGGPAG